MTMTLCVLLWAVPGHETELVAYEDEVLGLLGDHGGRVRQRVRRTEPGDSPYEVQTIELPDDAALNAYLADPRRLAAWSDRDGSVARTEIIRVDVVSSA